MNLQLSSKDNLTLDLGYCFYTTNVDTESVNKTIIINPKLNFGYWSKKLLSALNSGLISQVIYDAIKENENETKQYYTLEAGFSLDKNVLINLIQSLGLLGITTSGDSYSILVQLNELNYQLISKV